MPRRFPPHVIAESKKYSFDYSRFEIARSSMYSTLMPYHAPQMIEFFRRHADAGAAARIFDMTANIGGDAVNFALGFGRPTIAVEKDAKTFALLQKNIANFGVAVRAINADCLAVLRASDGPTDRDIVYFDPPWGGAEYKKKKRMMLYLSDVPVWRVVNSLLPGGAAVRRAAPVVLKTPTNFDFAAFARRYVGSEVVRCNVTSKPGGGVSYCLLFCR